MSVLKNKRKDSHVEYLNCAYKIYIQTIEFISKLSARYSRIIASDVTHTAYNVLLNCEAANTIFPSDSARAKLREEYLLKAKACLQSLDVALSIIYDILSQNPAGAFTTCSNKDVAPDDARRKLENMSQSLGELIDSETKMLTKILKNDRDRLKQIRKETAEGM